jgi:asparagine synthase (glutamine-hydrolysing)
MAFVAHMSWDSPARLDKAVVACIQQHAVTHPTPHILVDEQPGAAGAWVSPSRAARFAGGVTLFVSGRPRIARADPDESEAAAIYRSYRAMGAECIRHIAGSFSIVILDPADRLCLIARDRLGFVPLFYYIDRKGVWVADTIKPILASRCSYFSLDPEAIYRYIHLKAFESPDTVVNEIQGVRPGTLFRVSPRSVGEERYWDIPLVPVRYKSTDDGADDLEALLADAVGQGMGPGDRPTGILISGGLDSGVLSALAARGRPGGNVGINVAFESRWSDMDESVYARAVADRCGIPLHRVEFNHPRLVESLPTLWWNNHLPTANSGFKLNLIGLQADALGYPDTLMLGEGADTVLLYAWNWKYFDQLNRAAPVAALLPKGLRRDLAGGLERLLQDIQTSRLSNRVTNMLRSYLAATLGYLKWKGSKIRPEAIDALFHEGLREHLGFRLLSQVFGGYYEDAGVSGFSEQLVYASLKSYIPNQQLMNYHTSSNYFGAELACPFADERVVSYCVALPWYEREHKRVLKTVAERWLPHDLVHRRKCAFLMPMNEWIKTHFRPLLDAVFARENLERRGVFDPAGMAALKETFLAGRFDAWPDLWTFVVLEAWMRINLDANIPTCPGTVEEVFPELEGLPASRKSAS